MSSTPEGKPLPDITLPPESTTSHNARQLIGCMPVLGSLAVGVLGIILTVVGFIDRPHGSPPPTAAGLCLIASALGFGLLANAIWRR
jgi:hypothetical protein